MTKTKRSALRNLLVAVLVSSGTSIMAADNRDYDASPVDSASGSEVQAQFTEEDDSSRGILHVGHQAFASLKKGGSSCGSADVCPKPWWAHRCGAWGEALYLRPGGADTVYSIEQNDTTNNAFPTGPVGNTAIQEELGFRVGFSIARDCDSSYIASFSTWSGDDDDRITRTGTNILRSEILHPSTVTTGAQSLQSSASQEISFQTAELAHRSLWIGTEDFAINSFGGFRYGNLEQQFHHEQEISVATGLVTADTDIDFNGLGLMFGLDGATYRCETGLMCYSRGMASFLAGEWDSTYRQFNQIPGGIVANQFEDFRITPQAELELGFGWQSKTGCLKLNCGYLTSAWFNAITTDTYVEAVQASQYTDLADTITFSGIVTRAEFQF